MAALAKLKTVSFVALLAWLLAKRAFKHAKFAWVFKRVVGKILCRVLPVPIPRVVAGVGATSDVAKILRDFKCKKPLIVTDAMLVQHGLLKKCTDSIESTGLQHVLMDSVVPDPPSELMDEGAEMYRKGSCDSIVAFGGGSPMDVAKLIGAKVVNPTKSVHAMAGFFNVNQLGLKPLPPLIAVPTTAGTGSETTVAAIATVKQESRKYMVADIGLVPRVAILDPEILVKLPKHITAATGLDAVTHAVESYLGGWVTGFSREKSLSAVSKLFADLPTSYQDGSNLRAREACLQGSFEAGLAFTRANVGYVHAISHQFGALFHTPHGDGNAMMLPHLLTYYLDREEKNADPRLMDRFCDLAKAAGLVHTAEVSNKRDVARKFVAKITEMCSEMNIPAEVKQMKASDVENVAERALRESHGELHNPFTSPVGWLFDLGYPTPVYMTQFDCEELVAKALPAAEKQLWYQKRKE